jgi:hypothetical protein
MSEAVYRSNPLSANFTVLLFSIALLSGLGLSIWLFGFGNVNTDSALLFTRYTARVSFFFFLPVFVIHSVNSLAPGSTSRF